MADSVRAPEGSQRRDLQKVIAVQDVVMQNGFACAERAAEKCFWQRELLALHITVFRPIRNLRRAGQPLA